MLNYNINDWLDLYKFLATFSIFIFASYSDIKYREISDLVWIILIASTFPVTIFQIFYLQTINLLPFLILIAINIAIASIMYLFAGFGPADSIAVITLALAVPIPPNLGYDTILVKPLDYPLSVVLNGIILSVFYVFVNIVKNFTSYMKNKNLFDENFSLGEKLALFFFAQKINKKEIENKKFYVSLIVNKEGRKRLELFRNVKDMDFEDINARKGYYEDDYYWAENVQPFLVYLTISLLFTYFVGDLVTSIAYSLVNL